ncbi:MAG TPA: DUF2332 domain-containing protein [Nocardioidaceae bacterium]|nr:DUF2332 domain-containing protein [Nocardioidaceae bacterium]
MADRFREQAAACAGLGSPMYDQLLKRVAADIDEGGASTDVLAGHEDDPGSSALALRLAGSVHRLVLDGRAPELAAFYPSAGGCWDLRQGWPAFDAILRDQPEQLRGLLGHPPQTNEVGRAAALMGGLLRVGESHRLPVRLLEIGSSGGLNLRADQFCYQGVGGWRCGRKQSPVRLEGAWQGIRLEPWDQLEVVERIGSDVSPVDVSTAEGRLTLASYVWPDQVTRAERLRNAYAVAAELPAQVRRQDAVSFVGGVELVEGTTTVLWHSVMWQYLSAANKEQVTTRVAELGAGARESAPFAHLFLEPARRTPEAPREFLVVLHLWPPGLRRVLGTSLAHGLPTTWE